jgi:predicted permease
LFVVNLSLKFALLILTRLCGRQAKVLPPGAQKTLMGLVMNITLPCLIIGSFAVGNNGEELWKFGAMLLSARRCWRRRLSLDTFLYPDGA